MNNLRKRFFDAPWMGVEKDIVLVGIGGAGYGIAMNLLAIGHNVNVFEHDTVSEENCIPQGYQAFQVGQSKTTAFTMNVINNFNNRDNLHTYSKKYDGLVAEVMITAADSMLTRNQVLQAFLASSESKLFIDTRMSAERFEIYTLDKNSADFESNLANYMQHLPTDEEVADDVCTFKATRFTANVLHGTVTRIICNYVLNEKAGELIYSVPSHYEWNGLFFDL